MMSADNTRWYETSKPNQLYLSIWYTQLQFDVMNHLTSIIMYKHCQTEARPIGSNYTVVFKRRRAGVTYSLSLLFGVVWKDSDSALPCPVPPPTMPPFPSFPPLGLALPPCLNMKHGMGGHHLLLHPGSQVGMLGMLQAPGVTLNVDQKQWIHFGDFSETNQNEHMLLWFNCNECVQNIFSMI